MDEPKLQQPTEGGTYVRNPNGTLTCVERPTKPAKFVPTKDGYVVEQPAAPEATEE